MDMAMFADTYRNRRVLVTGHTGFKGSWLSLWLTEMGAEVSGIALAPQTEPSLWNLLQLKITNHLVDVRDAAEVAKLVAEIQPEIVFHLAAQPLVRRSYANPLETWSTNVMGAANVLDACRLTPGVRAIVMITTDKVYENQEWSWGYRENDRIGGHDPYSASKAAIELLTESYRSSFFKRDNRVQLATARAGNVIGGGDWSQDRLIPDLMRAAGAGVPLEIRSPNATRPWQHVLECVSGYMLLGQKLLAGEPGFDEAWNFGPEIDSNRTVHEVLTALRQHWDGFSWRVDTQPQPHESNVLYLDNSKAKARLGWQPVWTLTETLAATVDWYNAVPAEKKEFSLQQLADFVAAAREKKVPWAES